MEMLPAMGGPSHFLGTKVVANRRCLFLKTAARRKFNSASVGKRLPTILRQVRVRVRNLHKGIVLFAFNIACGPNGDASLACDVDPH